MKWTHADQEQALAQGWGLFENSEHGLRIERYDAAERFANDAAAATYVALRAMYSDHLAWHAMLTLGRHYDIDALKPRIDRRR